MKLHLYFKEGDKEQKIEFELKHKFVLALVKLVITISIIVGIL